MPDSDDTDDSEEGVEDSSETRKAKRKRNATRDAATQHGGHIDWPKYELGKAMQKLRSHKKGLVRKTLRLLHIRWYHAGTNRMTNILRAAGVPPDVLTLIPATVNCCRICRAFRRPKPHSVATSRAPTAFNDVVQHDILYLLT